MRDRDGYLAGVPCWIDLVVPDPQAAAAFYGGLFGWELKDTMPAEVPGHYFQAFLDGLTVAAIGSAPPNGLSGPPAWSTYVCVDSADAAASRVAGAGGRVVTPPMDVFDAGRMAEFVDPQGAAFAVWQPGRHKGAQLVNSPGSWNWSDLNTRDPEAAKAFYGAVFGWEVMPVDFGSGEAWMWRKPGYADFLEQRDPGVRQRHIEGGAPEGFTDAIGWLQVMSDEQYPPDAPAHWAITFSVDDADATAARAQELGGSVVVPPFTVPYSRLAVIRDPQGAVFTASKYLPSG